MNELMRFFENHQAEFAQNHHRQFVLIRQLQKPEIVDFIPWYGDAFASAVFEAKIPPENFPHPQVPAGRGGEPAVFHSRVR